MTQQPKRNQPFGFGNPWLQLGLSVLCVLVSELLLKRGATDIADLQSAWSWTGINGLVSPLVWWAIILIVASFVSWLYVLRYITLTISFFLTLGLLQRFDLSYLYPFQGLSVIIVTLMAAFMLKEKLTFQLTIGALLISAGIMLVSLS